MIQSTSSSLVEALFTPQWSFLNAIRDNQDLHIYCDIKQHIQPIWIQAWVLNAISNYSSPQVSLLSKMPKTN